MLKHRTRHLRFLSPESGAIAHVVAVAHSRNSEIALDISP